MRTTSTVDEAADGIVDAMSALVRAWRGAGRHLPGHAPVALHQPLHLLADGPQRLGEVAARRGIDQSVVSRQVGELVARGLVDRRPDPSDGRACLLALTPAGRDLVHRADARRHELIRGALARNPAADLPAVTRFVTALAAELTSRRPTPTPEEHRS